MSRFPGWSEKDLKGLNIIQDGGTLVLPGQQEQKKNKYNAIKTEVNGEVFDSMFEADYGQQAEWRVKAGDIKGYRRQVRIPLVVAGVKVCDYIIDYVLEHLDGSEEYVEVKGVPTSAWRIKWKLFKALYPDFKTTVIMKPKSEKRKKTL
jgi:DNA-binding sugar fermentation-stimulating protein